MSDRVKRRKRRRRTAYLLLALLVFLLVRFFGPTLITIRGTAVEPLLQTGDIVLARRVRNGIPRGAVVVTNAPLRTGFALIPRLRALINREDAVPVPVGRPVPRIVLGLPGETVAWDHSGVTVGGRRYETLMLHEDLPLDEEVLELGEEEFFLLSLQPGRADSRIIGPVSRNALRFHVQSIVWPGDRRGVLDPAELNFP